MKFSYLIRSSLKILGDNTIKLFFFFFILYSITVLPILYFLKELATTDSYVNMITSIKDIDVSMDTMQMIESYSQIAMNNQKLIFGMFFAVMSLVIVKIIVRYILYIYEYNIVEKKFSNFFKILFNYRSFISLIMLLFLNLIYVFAFSIALRFMMVFPILIMIFLILILFALLIFDYCKMMIYISLFNSYKKKKGFFETLFENFKKTKIRNYGNFFNRKLMIYLIFALFISSFFVVIPVFGVAVKLTFDSMILITLDLIYIKTDELKNMIGEIHENFK